MRGIAPFSVWVFTSSETQIYKSSQWTQSDVKSIFLSETGSSAFDFLQREAS